MEPSLRIATSLILHSSDRRAFPRIVTQTSATMRADRGDPVDAVVVNISRSGLLFETSIVLAPGTEFSAGLPGVGMVMARVARADGRFVAAEFARPLTMQQLTALGATDNQVAPLFQELPEPIIEKSPLTLRLRIIFFLSLGLWVLLIGAMVFLR